MTAQAAIPSIDVFRQLLRYDYESGRLYWMPRPESMFEAGANPVRICRGWNTKYAGRLADETLSGAGYRVVCVFDKRYLAHRVAWAIFHGAWPAGEIDHINQDKTDNRLKNLRDVSRLINARNQPVRSDNKSGITGIWQKSPKAWGTKWAVVVSEGGRITGKRSFKCLGEAIRFRNESYRERGFNSFHGNWKSIGDLARKIVEGK